MTNTIILGVGIGVESHHGSGRYSDDNMSIFRVFW